MIPARAVFCLALSQLIAWGVSYYLIGVFADLIAADLGWSRETVYGGFALALVVMGLVSPLAGRLIDRHGGRPVMVAGALVTALGCLLLARMTSLAGYYAAWTVLGVAMRLTLYDAAFAALARLAGAQARRPMSQITLLGGLASTAFWPFGHFLAELAGWRGAVAVYAGFALLTIPLYLALPRHVEPAPVEPVPVAPAGAPLPVPSARRAGDLALLGALYALSTAGVNFLNAGMSSHMIGLLTGLGLGASAAVWLSTLRGIGQSLARFGEVLSGGRLDPLALNLVAALLLPLAFGAGLFAGSSSLAAGAFAFLYGAGNGLLTITRGTLPLVLFDPRSYGRIVGRLIAPSFLLSACAPLAYALIGAQAGPAGSLLVSLGLALVILAAALALRLRARPTGANTD